MFQQGGMRQDSFREGSKPNKGDENGDKEKGSSQESCS
jgi:hypothetical protein